MSSVFQLSLMIKYILLYKLTLHSTNPKYQPIPQPIPPSQYEPGRRRKSLGDCPTPSSMMSPTATLNMKKKKDLMELAVDSLMNQEQNEHMDSRTEVDILVRQNEEILHQIQHNQNQLRFMENIEVMERFRRNIARIELCLSQIHPIPMPALPRPMVYEVAQLHGNVVYIDPNLF
eukprot:TRINITY_DN3499_c0_g1_i5.p1 TRINITY_DN3499_c0_g1~~TRINITY_DN3499_c0_g1_i5.p1  ORF type:complete len:175 (-),score=34.45 TRINITY_DN3499_c0_g1_i5:156-680(-)